MVTKLPTDTEAFYAFLSSQLENGARDKSPEELLQFWREQHAAAVEDIRQGIRDLESGRLRPLREADEELRRKYNIPRDA